LLNSQVKNKTELATHKAKELIKNKAIQQIRESANEIEPLFAEQIIAEQLKDIEKIIDIAVEKFIENTIEIPRMTVQKEIFHAEYQWFDLDTSMGFDLPSLSNEIIRISIGAGEKNVDIIQAEIGRKFDKPINQIINALIDYDDVDYDQNSELLYHLSVSIVSDLTPSASSTFFFAFFVTSLLLAFNNSFSSFSEYSLPFDNLFKYFPFGIFINSVACIKSIIFFLTFKECFF
jgi:type III restriction enzyme